MNRRQRRDNSYGRNNISMYLIFSVVGVIVIAFILAYVLYSNKLSKQQAKVVNIEKISSVQNTSLNMIENVAVEETSSSMGKTVNEVSENVINTTTVEKVAVNTSKQEKEEVEKRNEETNTQNANETVENEEAVNEGENIREEVSFIKPVEGEVIKDYSKENLIYSNTLEEWTTHLGIDYASEKTSVVKAAADGTIKSIKNDPRYGLTIVIEHANGFESKYSSLLSSEFVSVGEKVSQGQTIGTVGNTAIFEIADETHLHFEITKDGEDVDPNIYIK